MIDAPTRKAAYLLHQKGLSKSDIARKLHISRGAVRAIVEAKGEMPCSTRSDKTQIDPELLKRLHAECEGRKQRIHEKLTEQEDVDVAYSTLTRLIRELGLDEKNTERCDRVEDAPGQEMQHDTTQYTLKIGGPFRKVIASILYLRYSKRRYLEFFWRFDRFRMMCAIHKALMFWGHAAEICVIDNTNLARQPGSGTGKEALIVPQMASFAKTRRFEFRCHELKHANRKAGVERGFYSVETNFLPGRTFQSMEDLNRQAFLWATERMYHRPVGKAKVIPAKAFEHEMPYLRRLCPELPPPYRPHERLTDQYGYIAFDANHYWIPGTQRPVVRVIEYAEAVEIYHQRKLLAGYPLPKEGEKEQWYAPQGESRRPRKRSKTRKPTQAEEAHLRTLDNAVGAYLDFAVAPKGLQRHTFIRQLYALSRRTAPALFTQSIERALKYRIKEIATIENIIHLYLKLDAPAPPSIALDEDYDQREAYREGYLSDPPDLTKYDKLLEEDKDDGQAP